ncbi:MAG: 4Fe-4S dicluster domain-containing protein [Actinomycetota bacterium]|nr:MAG: 4Fe-4S dicluster domain-containing protein [Actinomycetota bacterium]
MAKREIITIDEEKCNGCGSCVPGCPEGALQIIDNKARLISDLFCDGLGACIGDCPEDAISIIEREAEPYDEVRVMENIVKQGKNTIKAHLEHLKNHGETVFLKQATDYLEEKGIANPLEEEVKDKAGEKLPCGCPGSSVRDMREDKRETTEDDDINVNQKAELRQWPVQIHLVPVNAPYFDGADLLITADCVPFAYGNFHKDLLKGKILLVGCPKLDDAGFYKDKITEILKENNIKSVTIAHMEVPCCFGLVKLVNEALAEAGKDILLDDITVKVNGEMVKN